MAVQKPTPGGRQPKRWERAFIAALAASANVSAACRAAKIDRTRAYELRREAPDFAAAWDDAMEQAVDSLEQEAVRRARDGVARLKFYKGVLIRVPLTRDGEPVLDGEGSPVLVPYVEHEYSDALLVCLLKAHRPEKYKDNLRIGGDPASPIRHEHSGSVNAEHTLDPAALRAFAADVAAAGLGDVPADGAR